MKAASALRINYWNRSMLVLRCSTPASQASGPRGSKWGCRRLCTTLHSQETRKTSSKSTSVLVWRHPMNMRRSTVSNNSLSRSSWLDARQYLKLMEGGVATIESIQNSRTCPQGFASTRFLRTNASAMLVRRTKKATAETYDPIDDA